jgi:hypothetical protein
VSSSSRFCSKTFDRGAAALLLVGLLPACRHLRDEPRRTETWPVVITCPDAIIHTAFSTASSRVVSGCGVIAKVEFQCHTPDNCESEQTQAVRLKAPQRLRATDEQRQAWADPKLAVAGGEVEVDAKTLGTPGAPGAPKPLADLAPLGDPDTVALVLVQPGKTLQGELRVCYSAEGEVSKVTVVKSVVPPVDLAWIAALEGRRFDRLVRDGHAVAWCTPMTLTLAQ